MKRIIQFFSPDTRAISMQEKMLSAFLAFVATLICVTVSGFFIQTGGSLVYIASLGAAAVLIFAVPKSSFSQPWPVIASHICCSTIGVFCFQTIPQVALACSVAIGLSIYFMYMLRCLHPPGGAAALAVILGSPEIHQLGYYFVLSPVLMNVLIMVGLAYIVNNLVPDRNYPVKPLVNSEIKEKKLGVQTALYNQDDLDAALSDIDSFIDISRADLYRIYRLAVSHANQRRIGNVTCKNIMKPISITFQYGTELGVAWDEIQNKNLKGAAVVDPFNRVIGIVTTHDFLKHVNVKVHKDVKTKIQQFLKPTVGLTSEKPEVVGQIMTESPVFISQDQHIIQLIDIFSENDFHHIPVVDEKKYLVGMITRSDVMSALSVLQS
jgi:CBS domain-containing membrane protein